MTLLVRSCVAVSLVLGLTSNTFGQGQRTLLQQTLGAEDLTIGCEPGFTPLSEAFRVNNFQSYDQIWSQVAIGEDFYVFAFSDGLEVLARFFDAQLQPTGNEFQVNTTLTDGTQDEPAVSVSETGNVLIAWSDRNGYDGEQMGIFGRVYDSDGNPLGAEIQINQDGATSQWRPLIVPRPGGGWVVAWTGHWDGDSFYRSINDDGTPAGPDIRVNEYFFDAQVDPAPAVDKNGNVFVSFVDFSSHDPSASSLNLYGRTYDASGTPHQVEEFLITSWLGDGIQREPRVAADGQGRFLVVWEDELGDGNGYGLFGRRFDALGNAFEPEFPINSTTVGQQIRCTIAMTYGGEFLVAWEDQSTGTPRIMARRFDGTATPMSDEFVIAADPLGHTRPVAAVDAEGRDYVIAFDGIVPGFNNREVYGRHYVATGPRAFCTTKPNSQGCLPTIGFSGHASTSSSEPFWITAKDVRNAKFGLLFFGQGVGETPFYDGSFCVGQFLGRTPAQFSGGGGGQTCLGTYAFDFNAWIQGPASSVLLPGMTVAVQFFYRDPPSTFGVGLTNGLAFEICP